MAMGSPFGVAEVSIGVVVGRHWECASVPEPFKMVSFLLCGSHLNIKELKNKN